MQNAYNPTGPYYIALMFDNGNGVGPEQIQTGFLEGYATQDDAWQACDEISDGKIEATSFEGAPISIDRSDIVQLVIARATESNISASLN